MKNMVKNFWTKKKTEKVVKPKFTETLYVLKPGVVDEDLDVLGYRNLEDLAKCEDIQNDVEMEVAVYKLSETLRIKRSDTIQVLNLKAKTTT